MFSNILITLIILLILVYAGLIAMDLYKGSLEDKVKSATEEEEDIDISGEASGFEPTQVDRTSLQSSETLQYKSSSESVEEVSEKQEQVNGLASNGEKSLLDESVDSLIETLGRLPSEITAEYTKEELEREITINYDKLREPVSDKGISAEELMDLVEVFSQKGASGLGDIIFMCDEAA